MISKQISFNLHQATIGENVHLFDVGHLTMWQTFSDSFEVSVSCTCFLSLAPLKEKSTSTPQSNFNISKVRLYLCQSDPPLQFLFLFHFFFSISPQSLTLLTFWNPWKAISPFFPSQFMICPQSKKCMWRSVYLLAKSRAPTVRLTQCQPSR